MIIPIDDVDNSICNRDTLDNILFTNNSFLHCTLRSRVYANRVNGECSRTGKMYMKLNSYFG